MASSKCVMAALALSLLVGACATPNRWVGSWGSLPPLADSLADNLRPVCIQSQLNLFGSEPGTCNTSPPSIDQTNHPLIHHTAGRCWWVAPATPQVSSLPCREQPRAHKPCQLRLCSTSAAAAPALVYQTNRSPQPPAPPLPTRRPRQLVVLLPEQGLLRPGVPALQVRRPEGGQRQGVLHLQGKQSREGRAGGLSPPVGHRGPGPLGAPAAADKLRGRCCCCRAG